MIGEAESSVMIPSLSVVHIKQTPSRLRLRLHFHLHGRAPTPESRREPKLRLIMLKSVFEPLFLRFWGSIVGPISPLRRDFSYLFSGSFFDPRF